MDIKNYQLIKITVKIWDYSVSFFSILLNASNKLNNEKIQTEGANF